MVADRHRLAAYHNKHCRRAFQGYQHRWPWRTLNAQNRGFSEFFAIWATAYTERMNFRWNCWRSTRQPAYEIILMLWRVSWALAQISCKFLSWRQCGPMYTVSQKTSYLVYCPYLWQIVGLTYFQNSFSGTLTGQLAIKPFVNIPPYHNSVDTLPCEI